jgi:hypothetical protein
VTFDVLSVTVAGAHFFPSLMLNFMNRIHRTIHTNKHYMSSYTLLHILDIPSTSWICLQSFNIELKDGWKQNEILLNSCESKMKFCFIECLSFQCKLSLGATVKDLFISLPLTLMSLSCRPNPVKLHPVA